jgi:hypothetical protein
MKRIAHIFPSPSEETLEPLTHIEKTQFLGSCIKFGIGSLVKAFSDAEGETSSCFCMSCIIQSESIQSSERRIMKLSVIFNFSLTSEYSISIVLIYLQIYPEVASLTS